MRHINNKKFLRLLVSLILILSIVLPSYAGLNDGLIKDLQCTYQLTNNSTVNLTKVSSSLNGLPVKYITNGNLNNDGNSDLVAYSPGKLISLLGDGMGSFPTTNSINSTSTVSKIILKDINNDLYDDLLVLDNLPVANIMLTGRLSVYVNDKNSSYLTPKVFYVGNNLNGIAIQDFNKDNWNDVLVSDGTSKTLTLLQNTKNTTTLFQSPPVTVNIGGKPTAINSYDYNNDGLADIVVAYTNDLGVNYLGVLRQYAPAKFTQALTFRLNEKVTAIDLGDVNKDSKVDIALSISGATVKQIGVLQAVGNTFAALRYFSVAGNPAEIKLANLNGDCNPDVVTLNQNTNNISILRGAGNSIFSPSIEFGVDSSPGGLVRDDFNKDGRHDFVAGNNNGLVFFLQKVGSGLSSSSSSSSGTVPSCMDSDGGQNYSVKGIVSVQGVSSLTTYTDRCIAPAASGGIVTVPSCIGNTCSLVEYSCTNSSSAVSSVKCYGCSDGVCNVLNQPSSSSSSSSSGCIPPPCVEPIVPPGCHLENTTLSNGCPGCPKVVCPSSSSSSSSSGSGCGVTIASCVTMGCTGIDPALCKCLGCPSTSSSSSSGGTLTCSASSNCPLGTCSDGRTFPKYNCTNGTCTPINTYTVIDPCDIPPGVPGGLTCDPNTVVNKIIDLAKSYAGIINFYSDANVERQQIYRFFALLGLLVFDSPSKDEANIARKGIQTFIGKQLLNNRLLSDNFKASLDQYLLYLVNFAKNCNYNNNNLPLPSDSECTTLYSQSMSGNVTSGSRILERIKPNKNNKFSIIPIPLNGIVENLNPMDRLAEIENKIIVANQRIGDLESLLASLSSNPTNGLGITIVSGLNTQANPNGANDINVVKQELLKAKAYKCELTIMKKFWEDLVSKKDCLIIDSAFDDKYKSIISGEALVTYLILGGDGASFDANPDHDDNGDGAIDSKDASFGIQQLPGVNNNDLNAAINFLKNARNSLTFSSGCTPVNVSGNLGIITSFDDVSYQFRSTAPDKANKKKKKPSHSNKFSIVPIPLGGSGSLNTISGRLVEVNAKISIAQERLRDLKGLLVYLISNGWGDYDTNPDHDDNGDGVINANDISFGIQIVSGLNTASNPNGRMDANVVRQEIYRVRLYLYELNRSKDFWNTIQPKETCLNNNLNYINTLKKKVFDYEGLITFLALEGGNGNSFDTRPDKDDNGDSVIDQKDSSFGIQPVTGINVNSFFAINDALNKARKDIKGLCP